MAANSDFNFTGTFKPFGSVIENSFLKLNKD
jgi:hypothetical protein